MPQAVHLPSTPPAAERAGRRPISLGWLNPGLLRRFPATAVAGAVAAVLIIIAVTHGSPPNNANSVSSDARGHAPAAYVPAPAAEAAACSSSISRVDAAAVPSGFTQQALVSDPNQPAVHLVLATKSLAVATGQSIEVYAQLSVPASSAAAPGAAPEYSPATLTFRPCVSIGVGTTGLSLVPASTTGLPPVPGANSGEFSTAAPGVSGKNIQALLTFTVPAGLAPGTELHLIATIPAGAEGYGSPALTATLTLTTR